VLRRSLRLSFSATLGTLRAAPGGHGPCARLQACSRGKLAGTRPGHAALSRPWLGGAASLLGSALLFRAQARRAVRLSWAPRTTRMSAGMQPQEVVGHKAGARCFEPTLARRRCVAPWVCASLSSSGTARCAPLLGTADNTHVCRHAVAGSRHAQGRSTLL